MNVQKCVCHLKSISHEQELIDPNANMLLNYFSLSKAS